MCVQAGLQGGAGSLEAQGGNEAVGQGWDRRFQGLLFQDVTLEYLADGSP